MSGNNEENSISGAFAEIIRKNPGGTAITLVFLAWAAASAFDGPEDFECQITDHDPTSAITSVVCEPD